MSTEAIFIAAHHFLLFMSQSHCNRDRVHFVHIDVFVGVMVIKLFTIRQN